MSEEKKFKGANFDGFHAGPKEQWSQFKAERPEVPMPTRGKLFLRKYLSSAGMELSMNVIPAGKGMPFLHRHKENDEVYIIIGGRGQFVIDGECIDVQEGSVIRMSPAAARSVRNNGDAPLYFLCIQYRADSEVTGGTLDGQFVEGDPAWPTGQ